MHMQQHGHYSCCSCRLQRQFSPLGTFKRNDGALHVLRIRAIRLVMVLVHAAGAKHSVGQPICLVSCLCSVCDAHACPCHALYALVLTSVTLTENLRWCWSTDIAMPLMASAFATLRSCMQPRRLLVTQMFLQLLHYAWQVEDWALTCRLRSWFKPHNPGITAAEALTSPFFTYQYDTDFTPSI